MSVNNLRLAMDAKLPLISITTDDVVNVQDVLSFIAGVTANPLNIPEVMPSGNEFNKVLEDAALVEGKRIFFTSDECKNMPRLYISCVSTQTTIVFVNTKRSALFYDCGALYPPKEQIKRLLVSEFVNTEEEAESILPSFGGMTLKDVSEVSKLTITRDGGLSVRGVNETRRAYISKLKGVSQIDTAMNFYQAPYILKKWLDKNAMFFTKEVHPSLTPRGLLFDGPPGTGKTAAAKHIASEFGVPLYRLDLGGMMGKYVGDSENALTSAIAQLDIVEPCVVLFDEAEKVFNGNTSDSGVSSRLLSQLLWWLQEHKTRVFTVMTTNDQGKIPKELMREGRIDEKLTFKGIANVAEGQAFAKEAVTAICSDIHIPMNGEQENELMVKVKTLFSDSSAVAQAKIINMIHDLLRDWISAAHSTQG